MSRNFRIAMIPASTDGVNYYRLATWAFEMRKYRNTIVDLRWFRYCIDPSRPHPWQEDFDSQEPHDQFYGVTVGDYIKASLEQAVEAADIVVWHPVYYDRIFDFFLDLQHKYQKPFVVEMDDNIIDVPPWNEAYWSFKSGSSYRRIATDCMRNANGVIVTTEHLRDSYLQFNPNIHVVENSLDFKGDRKFVGWDKVSVRKHNGVRVGWIGGRSHFNDLNMIAPALVEVVKERPDVKLTFVNSALRQSYEALKKPFPFDGMKNVNIADRSVAINRYAPFMASFGFDIGLAPLVDCNFNRSKSNLRWLEYSALGIPTIATSVSHYNQTIRHGVDGILVPDNDLGVWKREILDLIDNESKRREIGRQAYKRVRKDFNVKRNAARYIRILKEICNQNAEADLVAA